MMSSQPPWLHMIWGLLFISHITHIIFARCLSEKHSSPFYFRTPVMSHSPSHCVSRCVYISIKGKSGLLMLSILWFSVNDVRATACPQCQGLGTHCMKHLPENQHQNRSGYNKECQLLSIGIYCGFTFILFQNSFLEGWTVNVTHPVCYLKGPCRSWTN